MTDLSDSDWDLINAYADGELPASDLQAFEARLSNELALQEALQKVQMVSSALAQMRPEVAMPALDSAQPANRNWRPLATCASFAAMAIVAAGVFIMSSKAPKSAIELHQAFLDTSYTLSSVSDVQNVEVQANPLAPELLMANLYLVEQTTLSGGRSAAHYKGRNNCRLTLISGPNVASTAVPEGVRAVQWDTNGRGFVVLASGMDQRRFNAIAEFLRQATHAPTQPKTVLAMKQATDAAAPCQQV
ncbi:anti-sigma factor family protein [Shimia sagamensis]|uniref:Anti-sigma factor n=1 Tax=Shimia sagamensis TaxID=1566352 RepID=A0ABY1P8Z4_9RHOB|nr:hypothetical protein [Shimia sagamensis]SMP29041.1 hypothetical protein SAMN06265373_106142 [Shimia sagamensis]